MENFTLKDSNIKKTGHSFECLIDNAMTINSKLIRGFLALVGLLFFTSDSRANGILVPSPFDIQEIQRDTIPLKDRQGDFITDDSYNPFDIYPDNIEQTVEFDPETNTYVVYERIGDEYFRMPIHLTFEEYLDWKSRKQQRDYFDKLAGFKDEYNKNGSDYADPLSKINIEKNMADRLFGGNEITIEPQGSIDMTFGLDYTENRNPFIDENRQKQGPFLDFGMDIKMNVEGKIGDKLNLGFNYDTQASFDFDRKIKLAYDSEQFSEDDIIKTIEAGNVSLPLRSNLIQGNQSLFGLKTELQFGNLRLTAIASQQRSQQETQTIQNGATIQEFELRPDDYDENRHFFISHYHRDIFEDALSNLPYINNNLRVTNIEVWISDDRQDYQQNQTMICAIADIGEPDQDLFSNPDADYGIDPNFLPSIYRDRDGNLLPDNKTNELYSDLIEDDETKRIERTSTRLEQVYGLTQPRDFNIFQGRKLNPSEFTFNDQLGFISLNIRLRPNQVLAISYEYFYTLACDDIYKVGTISDEGTVPNTNSAGEVESQGVIFSKLIKSSDQRVNHPTWDLMMKNVYPLRSNNLSQTDLQFDIFYEDDQDGTLKKFLPEDGFRTMPLLNIFGLDRLNSRNDPQPDGVFDFVPGVTVVPQSSSIVFPVLEPFGRSLEELLGDPQVAARYSFPELYDTTVTGARELLVKNKFVMAGRFKSDISSEYSLGAWNIPPGSVRVSAGGRDLVEGADFEVDYAVGRVRIINESLLQQGTPINISYEDNSVFSLQQKTMLGLRAEYKINDNFYVGGTMMRLFERPFTQKVNLGDDPINNKVYGLDLDYSSELPFLTRLADKLPFYSTNVPSNINISAEFAALKPGHSKAINLSNEDSGVVSIDDFEGAVSGFPLSSQSYNAWIMSSVPRAFKEGSLDNDIRSGANRARLSWYVFDQTLQFGQNSAEANIGNSYTRNINQQELFTRDIPRGTLGNLQTFDMTYIPSERGPYNFDVPGGYSGYTMGADVDIEGNVILNEPETRWAGIMRYMPNSDFEANNYEFIDFWLLNPFMEKPDGTGHIENEEGYLTFHLGNVSEDILYDNLQFFENAIPTPGEQIPTRDTEYGRVSLGIPKNDGFDSDGQAFQDLGMDGLNNAGEAIKYQEYLQQFPGQPLALNQDPCGDDYVYFNDFDSGVFQPTDNILKRYSRFNNPEGNSPDIQNSNRFERGNPRPDKEDLNNNRSLDQGESYYEYKVKIANSGGEIDMSSNEFIRDERTIINPTNSLEEKWYRFRIPIRNGDAINGIEGFRSIQFMRLLVNGFSTQKTFRMAEFELVRNQWRKSPARCLTQDGSFDNNNFSVDAVGIEENDKKLPFNYVLPRGIKQERIFNTFSNVLQDEKSLSIVYDKLVPGCDLAIYRLKELDLRLYKRMQMFVHAEEKDGVQESGDVGIFLRVGKDFEKHYYEYMIPMTLSSDSTLTGGISDSETVWPESNMFDFELDWLVQAKKIRNVLEESFNDRFEITQDTLEELFNSGALSQFKSIGFNGFVDTLTNDTIFIPKGHKITIIGNPSVGKIKGIQVGLRNISDDGGPSTGYKGEVWINELRLTGLEERGGIAAQARLDLQIADLGNFTAAGSYSSIGWGALDQKVQERAMESVKEYDFSTNLELGHLLPDNWNISVPFYAQYSKSIITPEFDAYDLDITVEDEFDLYQDKPDEIPEISDRNQIVNTIKTFNFTNVRKERAASSGSSNRSNSSNRNNNKDKDKAQAKDAKKQAKKDNKSNDSKEKKTKKPKKPMPWDIENLSASYAFTQIEYKDPLISSEISKDYRIGLDYSYTRRAGYIQPFKFIKSKNLAFIKEINFNPLPNSFSFSSNINRFVSTRRFRIPETPIFEFDDRRFEWERRYDMNWNLTKSIKMNFSALNESYVDELRQRGIADQPENRPFYNEKGDSIGLRTAQEVKDYWQDNLKSGGRNTNYNHQASINYTLPFKHIPYMDWVDVKASYRTSYSWASGPLIDIQDGENIGNIIQNSQNRSVTANLSFDKLYDKSKYLKKLDRIGKAQGRKRSTRTSTSRTQGAGDDTVSKDKNDDRKSRKDKEREPGALEKLFLRPLFILRSIQFNYKEDFTTIVPGFVPEPSLLGLSSGFDAPGYDFAFGIQPNVEFGNENNWLYTSADKGWITNSTALNQEVIQTEAQNLEAKIRLEPWKDFRINIDFSKSYRATEQQDFKYLSKDGFEGFTQLAYRNVGTFEMTYMALNTLFGNDINALFNSFERNRTIISYRLDNAEGSGAHSEDGVEFAQGYGKTNSAVLIPAFLATYTNEDPNTISLDLEGDVKGLKYVPRPNWSVKYDGLNKLPWFKDKFSSFTLEHGYSSMLRVNSFYSDVEYDSANPYVDIKPNGNYYSRLEIPNIVITENFSPLIGLKMKTRSDLNIDFEWKKSRSLDLSANVATELFESQKTEFIFGFGYTIKDSNFLKKKNKSSRRGGRSSGRNSSDDLDSDKGSSSRGGRSRSGRNVSSSRGSDMTIMLSFSYIDDISLVHELDFAATEEKTRGAKTLSFSPSVDYILNENLTLRAFFEYTGTRPYITESFPFTSMSGGITLRMTLN